MKTISGGPHKVQTSGMGSKELQGRQKRKRRGVARRVDRGKKEKETHWSSREKRGAGL